MVWLARGTQGRTDLGLCWAPRPVTTLGVYKVLGIIVGFWQKAMELKSLRMAFKEKKTSLRIPSVPASAPSEMQTPGHPWLCPQPTSSGKDSAFSSQGTMNLHTVGLQKLRRLTPPPLQPEPSPGIKTAVESLWPKPWLWIPGAHYSL